MKVNVYSLMPPAYYDLYDDIRAGRHGEYRLSGGRGSCKSSFAALVILVGMLADPDANAAVYRKVARTLKDSVYASFERAAEKLGVRHLMRFRLSPPEIEIVRTGQRILFRGADDPLKSKSIAVTRGRFVYLWFEETSEFSGEEDLRSIIQSVLRGTDDGRVICTFNPPRSPAHWINRASLVSRPDRLDHFSTYLDVPEAWLGKTFLTEAAALKAANGRAYRNEYLGEVTGSGGKVFENAVLRKVSDGELNAFDRRYYGLDFGFAADPDAFTCWAYDKRTETLWAADEYVSPKNSAEKLAEEVLARAGRNPVICDSADPRMISALRALGVNARPAKKGPGSREHGYRWLETRRAIVIDPARTPRVAEEMSLYEYGRDRDGNFTGAYPDGNDHTLDSARYAMESETVRRAASTRSDIY